MAFTTKRQPQLARHRVTCCTLAGRVECLDPGRVQGAETLHDYRERAAIWCQAAVLASSTHALLRLDGHGSAGLLVLSECVPAECCAGQPPICPARSFDLPARVQHCSSEGSHRYSKRRNIFRSLCGLTCETDRDAPLVLSTDRVDGVHLHQPHLSGNHVVIEV